MRKSLLALVGALALSLNSCGQKPYTFKYDPNNDACWDTVRYHLDTENPFLSRQNKQKPAENH